MNHEASDGDHHRSKKNVRDLLEAAARLAGEGHSVYFGPERQKQFADGRESELKLLASEKLAEATPETLPNFSGGEHQVWIADPPDTVIKHTLPGFYGRIMDEAMLLDARTFQNRRRLTMRGALPSEYLRRWAVIQDIFGFQTAYDGRVEGSAIGPQMAVSQPYIEQDDADPAVIDDVALFMEAHGFTKVEVAKIAIREVAEVTWYRQRDGILITDAHARNFRKETTTGALVPVDLVVALVPVGVSGILPRPEAEWRPRSGD